MVVGHPKATVRIFWDIDQTLGEGSSVICLRLNFLLAQWDSGPESDFN